MITRKLGLEETDENPKQWELLATVSEACGKKIEAARAWKKIADLNRPDLDEDPYCEEITWAMCEAGRILLELKMFKEAYEAYEDAYFVRWDGVKIRERLGWAVDLRENKDVMNALQGPLAEFVDPYVKFWMDPTDSGQTNAKDVKPASEQAESKRAEEKE